jgi:UDP-GlcNAc:undecaprenyl-phosphate GlcNAc-1-phosphate transferase
MLSGVVLTPAVRALAHRSGALDHALTTRKIHDRPIPRLGGIAIVLAFFAPLVALLFVDTGAGRLFLAHPEKAAGLFAGGAAIAALGIWDDLRGANAKTKFLVQFAVAGLMYALGFRIDHIASPHVGPIHLGWFGLPFTVLWIAGVINAMNLIDGLDGLAGGVALIAISTTFAIAVMKPEPLMVVFTAALGGAVLGFLFYNFNPASIFMGDTGSMFLGFVLATTSIQTNLKSSTTVAIVVPIIALGVPIADTLLAMARRAARGVPLFSGDRGHIHHRLLATGLSQRQTVLIIYGVCLLLGGTALTLTYATSKQATLLLIALSLFSFLVLRRLGFISFSKTRAVLRDRRRNMEVRAAIRRVGDAVRSAEHVGQVWVGVRMAARALGASAVALHLPNASEDDAAAYSEGFDDAPPELFRARYGLLPERIGDTHIELGWDDGRTEIDRDTEIAVELLCDHLSTALERIQGQPSLLSRVVKLGS